MTTAETRDRGNAAHSVPPDVRIFSPHLDDAVLSCGGAIAEWTAEGRTVEVRTVFTADEPAGPPVSDLVAMLHRVFALPGGVVKARRFEDESAVGRLGAVAVHEPRTEGIYRTDGEGTALYPKLKALFGEVRSEDAGLEDELVEDWLALPMAGLVLAPLGVGGHADHRLVRRAAERAFGGSGVLELYEDVPYVMKWRALSRVVRGSEWRSRSLSVSSDALDLKIAAVADYRSQIRPLFGSPDAMERRLRRFHRRRQRAERLWTRGSGAASGKIKP